MFFLTQLFTNREKSCFQIPLRTWCGKSDRQLHAACLTWKGLRTPA
jgi:hypothetical protein